MNTASAIITGLATVAATADKFDAVYLNTPWNKLTVEELQDLPVGSLAKDDASLFMWTDSATAGQVAPLLSKWGYQFQSVHSIVDFAEKLPAAPAPVAAAAAATAAAAEKADDSDAAAERAPVEDTDAEMTDAEGAAPAAAASVSADEDTKKVSKPRGPRVKVIQPFPWWPKETSAGTMVRACTEQLWVATRGAGAALNPKFKTAAFQVQNMPEAAKGKSRSRRPAATCPPEWFMRRPGTHIYDITAALAPGSRIIELFGDAVYAKVHAFGPGIVGGYIPALQTEEGVVGTSKAALQEYGKVALRAVAVKLRSANSEEEEVHDTAQKVYAAAIEAANGEAAPVSGLAWAAPLPAELKQTISYVADHMLVALAAKGKKAKRAPRSKLDADGNPRPLYGIAAKELISDEASTFIGKPIGELIAWTQFIKLVNEYVTENGLRQGEFIVPDEKLCRLLNMQLGESVKSFDLGDKIKHHYIGSKKRSLEEAGSATEDEEEAKKVKTEAEA